MSKEEVRAAANLWRQVWNEGRLDLVSEALAASYIRHEPNGTRTVTMEQYREEIAAMQKRIPNINFTFHDEVITDNTWWVRWTLNGTNAETSEPAARSGLQVYRIANGRLVETWWALHGGGPNWGD